MKKKERLAIIGYCDICGRPVTRSSVRIISTGNQKQMLCEKCFFERYVEPRIRSRIFKYTPFFRRKRL